MKDLKIENNLWEKLMKIKLKYKLRNMSEVISQFLKGGKKDGE